MALNKTIFATFSEDMNPLTIDEDTFSVVGPGLDPVGVVDYDPVTHTASFDPIINLAPNASYTATILTRATDLAGNPLEAPFTWSFRTGTNTAQDVPQQDVPLERLPTLRSWRPWRSPTSRLPSSLETSG